MIKHGLYNFIHTHVHTKPAPLFFLKGQQWPLIGSSYTSFSPDWQVEKKSEQSLRISGHFHIAWLVSSRYLQQGMAIGWFCSMFQHVSTTFRNQVSSERPSWPKVNSSSSCFLPSSSSSTTVMRRMTLSLLGCKAFSFCLRSPVGFLWHNESRGGHWWFHRMFPVSRVLGAILWVQMRCRREWFSCDIL